MLGVRDSHAKLALAPSPHARISHQPLDVMTKLFTYPMVAETAHGF